MIFGLWTSIFLARTRPDGYFKILTEEKSIPKPKEALSKSRTNLIRSLSQGIQQSRILILTLGLTEVWRLKSNGRYACADPGYAGGGGQKETDFYLSTFEDNLNNLRAALKLLFSHYADRQVVLSVSPVPLGGTYREEDVYVANTESKAILRAAAGQIAREFESVHYFPSYEICKYLEIFSKTTIYKDDMRHVKPEVVTEIMNTFLKLSSHAT